MAKSSTKCRFYHACKNRLYKIIMTPIANRVDHAVSWSITHGRIDYAIDFMTTIVESIREYRFSGLSRVQEFCRKRRSIELSLLGPKIGRKGKRSFTEKARLVNRGSFCSARVNRFLGSI